MLSALRRVATLVAKPAVPEEIFAAVAEELAQLSRVAFTELVAPPTGGCQASSDCECPRPPHSVTC
jgi:hypothetical protein